MAKKTKPGVSPAKDKPHFFDSDVVAEPVFETGPQNRPYLVTAVPPKVTAARRLGKGDWPLLFLLALGCMYLRMSDLAHPNSVVFDEVHFGKFAKKYVVGTFFMDVHPPLAKMLFAAVSSLGGFTGNFDFENIGDVYPADVPYVLMRLFPAVLGSLTVLLCYLTLRLSGIRPTIAFLTSACLLVENSFVTISRYILLDAPLIFFIAAAVYAFKKFEAQQEFSVDWFRSLLSCAISLGLALSSKWVGLFTVAWVGALCLLHMWLQIGNLKAKASNIVKNAFFRASFLLVVPAVLYMVMFYIHFLLLSQDTPDSSFFSSAFKAGLEGSPIPTDTEAPIGYGSIISIRHMQTRGGYLHSHEHFYPEGSKQQQITLYPHLDANNDWIVEPYNFSIPDHFVPITHDTKIRLRHVGTDRRLHSHDEKAPVSDRDWQKEVTCYGHEGFEGDANDDWIVEVVKHKTPKHAQEEVRAIETVFRLRHAMSGLYLFSSEVKLPEWGFEQQEVTAASQGTRSYTHWYIESSRNSMYNGTERVSYPKLTFFQKFLESHKVMWEVNQGLTSHHNWQSLPYEWPLLMRGINYWHKHHTQIYFLGNPVVWWTATAALLGFMVHIAISLLKWQSGREIRTTKGAFNFNYQMFSYFLGWAAHYFPFFIMGRQLFLHHYLPSQYFAILGLGHVFELLVGSCARFRRQAFVAVAAFTALSCFAYSYYAPLVAGTQWTKSQCLTSKLVNGWDYDCNNFFDKLLEYEFYEPSDFSSAEAASAADTSVIVEAASSVQPVDLKPQKDAPHSQDEVLESPPPAETHAGQFDVDENGNVVVPEVIPLGEMYDEATGSSEEPAVDGADADAAAASAEVPQGQEVVVEDVLVDDIVVEDFVVKDAPESSIDLRIEQS
ncbi:hypothetical protein PUMCH_000660 [Australozyma saopauloensis]|uniref:Dolichyl-phosphate-mannose--protein mannosyltransferase n=1 Tax=Australozyma saopauloensis TaxID=291208 RepID=A0AAX4H4K9_9ASCO|nr:hypothetical protein PUMCH_000660 [[Candida] saopauloensis]